jgi:hypothetical protein
MSIRTDLKRSLAWHAAKSRPLIWADTVAVNLGLSLGVLARYMVLVGLNEALILSPYFPTPTDLWRKRLPDLDASGRLCYTGNACGDGL